MKYTSALPILKLLVLACMLSLGAFLRPVLAYNLEVTCGGSCTKNTNDPLFSSSTVWYPSLTEEKSVHVVNTRSQSVSLSTSATGSVDTNQLGDVITLTIKKVGEPGSLWTGTLTQFFASSSIPLTSVPANSGFVDLTYTAVMDAGAGNEYQDIQTVFDLNFLFTGEDEQTNRDDDNTDDGDGGGGSTTTTSTTTTTTTTAGTPLTQIQQFFAPFFPGAGSDVAGAETEVTPTPQPEQPETPGTVAGTSTCQTCIWWPFLVLQLLVSVIHMKLSRKTNHRRYWMGAVFIPVFTYALFLFFNRDCRSGWQLWIETASFWCRYFIIWVLLLAGGLTYGIRPVSEESVPQSNTEGPDTI